MRKYLKVVVIVLAFVAFAVAAFFVGKQFSHTQVTLKFPAVKDGESVVQTITINRDELEQRFANAIVGLNARIICLEKPETKGCHSEK